MTVEFKDAGILGGQTPVVHGLNMTVGEGDFVYIVGKVGSGKTSIIRTIIGESDLERGEGFACGFNLKGLKSKDIPLLRRRIGVVFQDFQLLTDRSVYENLRFVLRATMWKDERAISARIEKVLSDVGMKSKARKMPWQLSGGEQQRIAIARAILNQPELILADEPTGNLDPESADQIMDLLVNINRETGTAVIMVTHNFGLVERYPGRVFVCGNEKCVEYLGEEKSTGHCGNGESVE